MEDVNGDMIDDLVCQYLTTDIAALGGESTTATVNGELLDGTPIEGTDSVNIVSRPLPPGIYSISVGTLFQAISLVRSEAGPEKFSLSIANLEYNIDILPASSCSP